MALLAHEPHRDRTGERATTSTPEGKAINRRVEIELRKF
jgi:outer membrane protein OmpA-like peptidoglycan-associated protein